MTIDAELEARLLALVDEVTPLVTTPCQGGTHVKPDVVTSQLWLTASDICAGISWWAGWFGPFCDQLFPTLITMSDLCATVPPAPPTIDVEAMARNGTLYRLPNVLYDWLVAWWKNTNWNTFCECIGGTGCGSTVWDQTLAGTPNSFTRSPDRNAIPSSVTALSIDLQWSGNASTSNQTGLTFYNASNVRLTPDKVVATALAVPSGSAHLEFTNFRATYPAAATYGEYVFTANVSPAQTFRTTGQATYSGCSNPINPFVPPTQPPAPTTPPPPAPPTGCNIDDLCRRIYDVQNYLLSLTININNSAASATRSWREGISHVGLSGSGHLDLAAGASGVRAVVTTLPSPAEVLAGDPTFYWNMGFLTPRAIDVPLRGWRLVFATQVFELPGPSTGISWTLLHGTVMTLVELLSV